VWFVDKGKNKKKIVKDRATMVLKSSCETRPEFVSSNLVKQKSVCGTLRDNSDLE
jgi:hypothetical protein